MSDPSIKPRALRQVRLNHLRDHANDQFGRAWQWLKSCLERQNLLAGLKTFSWLAPLTLLIWIYAEREQTVPIENQTIPIDVRGNDPNQYVHLEMNDKNIMATLNGPRSRLDDVRADIAPQEGKVAVMLTIPDGLSAGRTHELDAALLLNSNPIFARRGVTVSNCNPARITVKVDVYQERELEVQLPATVTNLAGPPTFDTRKVRVRAPGSSFRGLKEPLHVEADLASLLNVEGQHEFNADVAIPGLPGEGAIYTPAKVKVNFEVRTTSRKGYVRSIPIYVSGPRSLVADYTVECPDVVTNVEVIGPPDKISELENELVKPWAVLQVSGDDKPVPKVPHLLKFEGLPEGVRVGDDDAHRPLDFKLVKKSAD